MSERLPMPTGADDLYSPDLAVRYSASAAAGSLALPSLWPSACGGAANAFLALVGPSRGHHTGAEQPLPAARVLPALRPMMIGTDVMNFDWGDHRKVRWTRLCAEMLGEDRYVRTMTALLNLNSRNATNEKDVPEEALRAGFVEHVWPLLAEIRPRLVCPLTNRVWTIMKTAVEAGRVDFPPCPVPLAREPIVFRLDGSAFVSFFVKPHNHPSRFLSNAQIVELGRACRWFLAQVSD